MDKSRFKSLEKKRTERLEAIGIKNCEDTPHILYHFFCCYQDTCMSDLTRSLFLLRMANTVLRTKKSSQSQMTQSHFIYVKSFQINAK